MRVSEVEESKTPIQVASSQKKRSPKIKLESILKKKNRFGLFFRKKLTLTTDHKLYYSDKKDSNKEPKYISLR